MHYAVIVVGDNVDELMAPFEEKYNETTEEIDGHWDWYVIERGRWTGFLLKDGSYAKKAFIEEIDIDELHVWALLYNGKWLERSYEKEESDKFHREMKTILKNLPNKTQVTLVDAHL